MTKHLQLASDADGEPVAFENGVMIPVTNEAETETESSGGPDAHGDSTRLLVDLITVYLESRPRRDQALPTFAALGVLFAVPDWDTAAESSRRLGNVSEASISRAKTSLLKLVGEKKSGRLPHV